MSAHTPGRFSRTLEPAHNEGLFYLADDDSGVDSLPVTDHKGMRRIAACWNACAGIPTEALEAGVVGELVEALEGISHRYVAYREHARSGSLPKLDAAAVLTDIGHDALAALAKARGAE